MINNLSKRKAENESFLENIEKLSKKIKFNENLIQKNSYFGGNKKLLEILLNKEQINDNNNESK